MKFIEMTSVLPGRIKTRAAHSDQIYIHSRCMGIDMRTRGFLPKIQGKKKVSATAALTCNVSVRRFGWNFETNFLLSFGCFRLENLFLLKEGSFRQEAQNELGVNEQQGRKKQFLLTTNPGQQCVQAEGKWRKNHCLEA